MGCRRIPRSVRTLERLGFKTKDLSFQMLRSHREVIRQMGGARDKVGPYEPITLGLDNESWNEKIPALTIPVPNTDRVIVVTRSTLGAGQYNIVTAGEWYCTDTLILTAAVVQDLMDKYVPHEVTDGLQV